MSIDATFPALLGMIDETGTVVTVALDQVLIHEIIHAVENIPDEPDIFNFMSIKLLGLKLRRLAKERDRFVFCCA